MMTMTSRILLLALALCLAGTVGAQQPAPTSHSGAFITRLGVDTLVVERFSFSNGAYNVEQVLHTPVAALRHTHLGLGPASEIADVIYMHHAIGAAMSAPLLASTRLTFRGPDSAQVETKEGDSVRTRIITARASLVPSLPQSWLPYEIAVRRLRAEGSDSATMQFLDVGGSIQRVVVRRVGTDSVTFTLPFLTYRAHVDGEGRITHLYQPNGVRVERVPSVDINGIAARWDSLERQGRGMGPLSPRDSVTARIGAADITVAYGRPSMRGRTIWGGLVPWNQVWRTGANDATLLRTSRNLTIGGVAVPAGSYTVTTMPSPAGTKLILSGDSDAQGGRGEPRAVARIDLATTELQAPVEKFTIAVEPGRRNQGSLVLSWDRRRMVAPIVVR